MEITEEQYARIKDSLPVQRGNVSLSNLQFLNALLYVAEHGCKWRGLPRRFGNWHTIYTRMNRWFSALKANGMLAAGSEGAAIHPAAAAREGEPIVVKHRVSPFVGTDLETLLRANGIDTLVLAGVHTSGVVLSTVRHAGDLDYRLVVVRDCCADPDAEVHAMLLDSVIAK